MRPFVRGRGRAAYRRCRKVDRTPSETEGVVSPLTCYFRHLKLIFEQIGIEVTSANRKEIDRKIHEMVGVPYSNCPAAWKAIKSRMAEDEEKFLADLDKALA